jgi:hypothetical protein
MKLCLRTLTFAPATDKGWSSGTLRFGDALTIVKGPNGSGKTPLMKGIAFALGVRLELPQDIRIHVDSVQLEIDTDSGPIRLSRQTREPFLLRAIGEQDPQGITFSDEKEFSLWLLERLRVAPRLMTGKEGGAVIPYVGLHVPCWWIDQDHGWRWIYAPEGKDQYVKDQEAEMQRYSFGLPARHPFEQKEELQKARDELGLLEREADARRSLLEKWLSEEPTLQDDASDLEAERQSLAAQLTGHKDSLGLVSNATAHFDTELEQALHARAIKQGELSAIDREVARLAAIVTEIQAEADILSSNETAERAFKRLCPRADCQLFRTTNESYGRRLLYLKDQTKDVGIASILFSREKTRVQDSLSEIDGRVMHLRSQRAKAIEESGHASLVAVIDDLAGRYAKITTAIERRKAFANERLRLDGILKTKAAKADEVRAIRSAGHRDKNPERREPEILRDLSDSMRAWLEILGTKNVDGEVTIDGDFQIAVGNSRFSRHSGQSGSTRTRLVLAYHAAALEVVLRRGGFRPPVLVLDSPRQHELAEADLLSYAQKLRERCRGAQIILSGKDLALPMTETDALWAPPFGAGDAARYLG